MSTVLKHTTRKKYNFTFLLSSVLFPPCIWVIAWISTKLSLLSIAYYFDTLYEKTTIYTSLLLPTSQKSCDRNSSQRHNYKNKTWKLVSALLFWKGKKTNPKTNKQNPKPLFFQPKKPKMQLPTGQVTQACKLNRPDTNQTPTLK